MPKLKNKFQYGNIDDVTQLGRHLEISASEVQDVVNGNLEFDINLKTSTVNFSFFNANQEYQITHNLGRTPIGYWLVGTNATTSLRNGDTAWDARFIYIKASAAADTKLLIF